MGALAAAQRAIRLIPTPPRLWPGALVLAAFAGALAAASAVALLGAVQVLRDLLDGAPVVVVLLAPVVAGLVYGPLVTRYAPDAGGGGVPPVRHALAASEPLRLRVAGAKGVAAALTLGSGGSGGGEGPIIQISAALGSALVRLPRVPAVLLRPVLAAAVAGGVAGSFQAPLTGVVLVAEVLLEGTTWFELIALVAGAVAGTATARALPFTPLRLPVPDSPGFGDQLAVLPVALLAGLAGVALVRSLREVRRVTDVLWRGPGWARPVAGGVLVGAAVLAVPRVGGIGQDVVASAASGTAGAVLLLAAAKIVATSVTLAMGGVGGTIGPSLLVGAAVGAAVPVPGAALAGMAACLAAGARAPATAAVLATELSGPALLPVVLSAAVVGWAVGLLLSPGTVFEPSKVDRR